MKTSFKPRLLTLFVLAALPGAVHSAFAVDYDGVHQTVQDDLTGQDVNIKNGADILFIPQNEFGMKSITSTDSSFDIGGGGNIGPVTTTNSNAIYGKSLAPQQLRISDDGLQYQTFTVDATGGKQEFDNVLIENKGDQIDIGQPDEIFEGTAVKLTGASKTDSAIFGPKAILRGGHIGTDPLSAPDAGTGLGVLNYQGSITVNQSHILGGLHGIYIMNDTPASKTSHVILNGATVTSGGDGIVQEGNGTLDVNGGTVTGRDNRGFGSGIELQTKGVNQSNNLNITSGATITGGMVGLNILEDNNQGVDNTGSVFKVNISDSAVTGGREGILIHALGDSAKAKTLTTLNLNHAQINSTRTTGSSAIEVDSPGATINIANGSQLNGGSGQALYVYDSGSADVNVDNSALNGNVLNKGTTNINLKNHASWTGTMQDVTNMTLSSGTAWSLTGNSSITGNLVNDGTVSLAHGSTPGNILTVGGNYTGNNGNLLFNTALGDDKSVTDKLLIKGNAAGTTNVSVTNAGGSGAKTIDGIEIIHVDGASTADTFKQKGRIVAGAYDYTLKHNDKSWYLDSHQTDPGPGPHPIPPIDHVVRPEAGSYIANIAAANTMFQTQLHDRLGETRYIDPLSGEEAVTSLWLRQVGNHNRFRDSSGQLKTQSNTYVAQLGGDVAQWSSTAQDRWHLGLMAGYGNSHSNTRSSISGHHAKGSVDGYSVGVYGTWFANEADRTGAYVDSQLQYGWFNNHVNGDDIAAESYKSKGLTASLETGYTFALGESGSTAHPTRYFIEPNVQATWMGVKADDLRESNGTQVSSQGDDNIQTRVGARAFMKGHSTLDNGKDRDFQPFVEVNWLHNTKRFGTTLNGVAIEQAGATNIGEMKVGVEGQLTKRMQLWGNVGQQLGDQGYSNTEATLGVKYAF